jgi:hypothetical protein
MLSSKQDEPERQRRKQDRRKRPSEAGQPELVHSPLPEKEAEPVATFHEKLDHRPAL